MRYEFLQRLVHTLSWYYRFCEAIWCGAEEWREGNSSGSNAKLYNLTMFACSRRQARQARQSWRVISKKYRARAVAVTPANTKCCSTKTLRWKWLGIRCTRRRRETGDSGNDVYPQMRGSFCIHNCLLPLSRFLNNPAASSWYKHQENIYQLKSIWAVAASN